MFYPAVPKEPSGLEAERPSGNRAREAGAHRARRAVTGTGWSALLFAPGPCFQAKHGPNRPTTITVYETRAASHGRPRSMRC